MDKNLPKRHPLALAIFAALNLAPVAYGAANNLNTPYTQDFDSLAVSGTTNVWTDDSTLNGWYSSRTVYIANTGGSNTGALYSFGPNTVTERALGSVASGGTGAIFYGARFINNTVSTITSLAVSYTGEQWRNGGSSTATPSVPQTIDFQYQVGAVSLTAGTWTNFNSLAFTTPIFGTTTSSALDGNAVANRLAKSATISVNVAPGQEIWLRWQDSNDANNDHGLGIDDLTVTPTFSTSNPSVNLSVSSSTGSEAGSTEITVTATASANVATDQTVDLAVTGAGISVDDYTLSNSTITIPSGSNTGTVTFTVIDDAVVEGTETATLTISNPSAEIVLGATTSQNVTITDNDSAPTPTVELSVSSNAGSEAGTTAITVTATASAAVTGAQTVDVAATGTGITAGDYTLSDTTIAIPNDGTTGSVTFTVVDDALAEGTETATLTISSPSAGIALGATTAQDIMITDNDLPCSATDTPIGTIQGSGTAAALTGTQTVQGVVVGDYEFPGTGTSSNHLRGFYLQDIGDGNPATSDGIFIFNGTRNNVSVGQVMQVTGTVSEFGFSSAGGTQTQITPANALAIENCGNTGTVTPQDINLPFSTATDLEQYEGMLVNLPQTLYVSEHFLLGRFGQVLLSSGDRLRQPTHVTTPGSAALAQQVLNDLNQIVLDDALQQQNPDPISFGRDGNPLSASNTLRGGDTVSAITGVLTQTDATTASNVNAATDPVLYRIRPINALNGAVPNFTAANPRPTVPAQVNGTLKVASANLLNFFDDFTNCGFGLNNPAPATSTCRGAENLSEFNRQWPKTVENLVGTGADVIAVNEIENDGYGANSAIQFLVNKLNAKAGAGTYAFINPDAASGQTNSLGTDAIKVGLIYKPATVTPVGTTAPLNTGAFGIFQTGAGNFGRSRPSLAQAFEENETGARVIVVANHFKSKGSACDDNLGLLNPPILSTIDITGDVDAGDGQGNCNKTRTAAAQELVALLDTNPTGTSDPDILIVGDLNSYAQEDPITTIKNDGYTNLIESRIGSSGYSFVFDGQWGYLDHALASSNLAPQVQDVLEWHINADEPIVLDYNTNFKSAGQISSLYAADAFRTSDHDPIIVGLNLSAPPLNTISGNRAANTLVGTDGRDVITGFARRDTLTGGGDRDQFVYRSVQDGIDIITDFTVNYDKIVLTSLLQSLGINNADPITAGYVLCSASGVNSLISIDPDASGAAVKRPLVLVKGVSCAALAITANFKF